MVGEKEERGPHLYYFYVDYNTFGKEDNKNTIFLGPGFVGMSYGFFLSAVCNTSTDAMKLAIR